ncbi:hypothetical protein [Psychromonas sp. MME2]|uniref:hypothetical protein n=1 Tax=unclassified Psychromonas TaxID=2614957 RepID=UPI00339C21C5
MRQAITLILMLTIMATFTQKAAAFASLLDNGMVSMSHCPMSMGLKQAPMEMDKTDCPSNDSAQTMDCQSDCDLMTVVSVLYFIDNDTSVSQLILLQSYHPVTTSSPYYFSESPYRPPFIG